MSRISRFKEGYRLTPEEEAILFEEWEAEGKGFSRGKVKKQLKLDGKYPPSILGRIRRGFKNVLDPSAKLKHEQEENRLKINQSIVL